METGPNEQLEESASRLCEKPSSPEPTDAVAKQDAVKPECESQSRLEPAQDELVETSTTESGSKTASESVQTIQKDAAEDLEKIGSENEGCSSAPTTDPVKSPDPVETEEHTKTTTSTETTEMELEETENNDAARKDDGQESEPEKTEFAHVNVEQSETNVAESSPKNALAETEVDEVMEVDSTETENTPVENAEVESMEVENTETTEVQADTNKSELEEANQEEVSQVNPTTKNDKNQEPEGDKKVPEETKDNDTEFVQITQDKNDDVQIESHSMDAEDPFGGDSMQGSETLEQTEKEAEQLGKQADNLNVDAEGDSACSSPKLEKSPDEEKSEKEEGKSGSTESDKSTTNETSKKDDAVVEVVAGQDDELCIIPDSMKIIIPRKEDQGNDKASADEKAEDAKEVQDGAKETEKIAEESSSEKDKDKVGEEGSKSKTDGGEIEIVDDEGSTKGSDDVEEIGVNQVCKQCEKTTVCKFVAKVGLETYNVCSKACKTAFQDDNNKSTDIPSDGVNSRKERRCANCLLIVESGDERNLSWETMEFCNEECLGKFQNKYGSYCRNCNGAVQPVSLGKYCVRFGYDVRQFCCSTCLEEFKKGLKVCSYCQKDISAETEGFLAPVGDKGQFKDFCTQDCMEKYSRMSSSEPVAPEKKPCGVCQEDKIVFCDVQIDRSTPVPICSEPCFAAFKFVNKVDPSQCSTCKKYFENSNKKSFVVFYEQDAHSFCSKTCLNVFIITNRKIVPCNWCKVKKYNFDMIKKELKMGQVIMMCSLNCLTLYQVSINAVSAKRIRCDYCKEFSQAQYHLTMSDATIRNFCSYNCVMNFQGQYSKSPITIPSPDDPVPTGLPKRSLPPTRAIAQTLKPVDKKTLPVISSVTSLASMANGKTMDSVSPTSVTKSVTVQSIGQMTGSKPQIIYKQQVIVRPPSPVKVCNRMTECKPITHTKGVYVRPKQSTVSTQTDEEIKPVIPIPVPIYVPFPTHMYSMPFPVPVPIPIPIPVPIFIPTTRNTAKGIMKEMKKIQEKMPSDPFEAELLMMAEMVATEKKAESDLDSADENRSDGEGDQPNAQHSSDSYSPENVETNNAFEEDVLQMALKIASGEIEEQPVDLEAALATNTITPSQGQTNEPGANLENQAPIDRSVSSNRGKKRASNHKTRGAPAKRGRKSTIGTDMSLVQQQDNQPAPPKFIEPVEKPDANMALKYTFGVNAWRQWVVAKNAELDKQTTAATPARKKLFKMDLLQLTADELNYSLCLFVKEVRKPNGQEYAPDTIYYLCLGIQQYLFENNRIDNIFTDPYYEKFTECLNDIAKKFGSIYNEAQYIVTRVEEEHLWESKQLGAHSPHVLLNTLMYFNTKHFNLVSVEEHMQLSFSHIMKHWKRNPAAQQITGNKTPGSRNVLLRFYPPQSTLDANSKKKKVYEQQENEENPLRCPVKLYEFYLSKCPESVKTRNDIFYLLPERSCVPDSPVWYSTSPLAKEQLVKMLYRIKMVKEINTALFNS